MRVLVRDRDIQWVMVRIGVRPRVTIRDLVEQSECLMELLDLEGRASSNLTGQSDRAI